MKPFHDILVWRARYPAICDVFWIPDTDTCPASELIKLEARSLAFATVLGPPSLLAFDYPLSEMALLCKTSS